MFGYSRRILLIKCYKMAQSTGSYLRKLRLELEAYEESFLVTVLEFADQLYAYAQDGVSEETSVFLLQRCNCTTVEGVVCYR